MSEHQKKVAVFTGTRAEYGLLFWLLKDIQADPELQLQLLVSGMHLSPEFGETYQQIERDGFHIDEKNRNPAFLRFSGRHSQKHGAGRIGVCGCFGKA